MITKLPSRHWYQLKDIFDEEFDSDLPDVDSGAEIFISVENGKRTGFILAEPVIFIGQIYIYPEFREKNIASTTLSLVKSVKERYEGQSVATLASESRFEKLYKRLGLDKISGTLFRKG